MVTISPRQYDDGMRATQATAPAAPAGRQNGAINDMSPRRFTSRNLALLAAVAALVACSGPAPIAPGAAAPYIGAARTSLESNHDGAMTPTFTFHSARCREDGGLVLLFEQRGGLGSEGLAFALAGTPSADAGVWAGGFAPTDADSDPEIVVFFAEASEVACK